MPNADQDAEFLARRSRSQEIRNPKSEILNNPADGGTKFKTETKIKPKNHPEIMLFLYDFAL
jgi:hypothetical protein